MAKKFSQLDLVFELIQTHQPCAISELMKYSDKLTKPGLSHAGSMLRKHGVIENMRYQNGTPIVRLTGKPYKQLCSECGSLVRTWSLTQGHCSYCAQKSGVKVRRTNPQVDAEFNESFAISRLMHLPFGLPAQTYIDYLQLKGAAL